MSKIIGYMPIIERVLDTVTGKVAEHTRDAPLFEDDPTGPHIYYWEEGNMACDCNRARIHGLKAECNSHHNRFKLNLLNGKTRDVLYSEFAEPLPHDPGNG